jgi:AcrR family transcriptional regulator
MGRKAGLTKPDIVAAAGAVADRYGYDGLTLARVAERLGIQSPSLYHHVEGLDDLRREVSILGARELGARFQAALADVQHAEGLLAMREMARAFRAFAHDHPGLYAAAQGATALDEDQTLYEAAPDAFNTVLGAVAGLGLPVEQQFTIIGSVRAALHGFISLEARLGVGDPEESDRNFEMMLELLESGVRMWVAEAETASARP